MWIAFAFLYKPLVRERDTVKRNLMYSGNAHHVIGQKQSQTGATSLVQKNYKYSKSLNYYMNSIKVELLMKPVQRMGLAMIHAESGLIGSGDVHHITCRITTIHLFNLMYQIQLNGMNHHLLPNSTYE